VNFQLRKEAFTEGMKAFGLSIGSRDIITYGCIKALWEFNVRIPQYISVIGIYYPPSRFWWAPIWWRATVWHLRLNRRKNRSHWQRFADITRCETARC
jgi:hypothetical protein